MKSKVEKKKRIKKRFADTTEVYFGLEPKPEGELTQEKLHDCINWYNETCDSDLFKKWTLQRLKELNHPKSSVVKQIHESNFRYCGIFGRMESIGWKMGKFKNKFSEHLKKLLEVVPEKKTDEKPTKTKYQMIQEGMREKTRNCLGIIEGYLDDVLVNGLTLPKNTKLIDLGFNIPQAYNKFVAKRLESHIQEFSELIAAKSKRIRNKDEEQLVEGWSNLSKAKMVSYLETLKNLHSMFFDAAQQKVVERKPRKRKEKSPDKLVAKLKYLKSSPANKIQSIDPRKIVGAEQLWVYNVKYRSLGFYHAADRGGFGIKGTTITNIDTNTSIKKCVRKPAEILPIITDGGKVAARKTFEKIRAVGKPLNGRINKDVVLLRVD